MAVWRNKKPTPKVVPASKEDNRNNNNTSTSKGKWQVKCFKCHKLGHKVPKCPRRNAPSAKAAQVEDVFLTTHGMDSIAFNTQSMDRSNRWCLDSGSTSHICRDANSFSDLNSVESGELKLASRSSTNIEARGTVQLVVNDGIQNKNIELRETLLVPDLRMNLMSVARITDQGYEVTFHKNGARVKNSEGRIKVVADRIGDLYYIL